MANTATRNANPEDLGHALHELSLDTFTALYDLDIGGTTLKHLFITVGAGTDFVLAYDNINPSLGTTAPDFQFPTSANQVVTFLEGGEIEDALTVTASNVGGTAASGNPGAANTVHVVSEPG